MTDHVRDDPPEYDLEPGYRCPCCRAPLDEDLDEPAYCGDCGLHPGDPASECANEAHGVVTHG